MKELHLKYLNKKVNENSLNHITSPFYKKIIINRGNWLLALITEKIKPITEAQKAFLIEFKKLSTKDSDFSSSSLHLRALILWKGKKMIKGISMNLLHGRKKNFSVAKKVVTAEDIKKMKNYNPPKKNKNKLDPEITTRWIETGFHTREGSKKMNKGRWD